MLVAGCAVTETPTYVIVAGAGGAAPAGGVGLAVTSTGHWRVEWAGVHLVGQLGGSEVELANAIGFDCPGGVGSCVTSDKLGSPLGPTELWIDARATGAQALEFDAPGATLYVDLYLDGEHRPARTLAGGMPVAGVPCFLEAGRP